MPQASWNPDEGLSREEQLTKRSTQELRDTAAHCEEAIASNRASLEEYELYVLCQRELARRRQHTTRAAPGRRVLEFFRT